MSKPSPRFIYKILCEDELQLARQSGEITTDLDQADGFVHLSTADQLPGTLTRFFSTVDRIHLIEFRLNEPNAALRWEKSADGDVFPHLYRGLNLNEANRIIDLVRKTDGQFDLEGALSQ